MKTAGIIAEYNPFHNGHKYHIEQTRKKSQADGIIAVMSGNFVQRGGAALTDKFSRAKAALEGGADLVAELPCVFACQSAERFAFGGVKLLEAMGCSFLSFGAETDSIDDLQKAADSLKEDNEEFKQKLADMLSLGKSYPRALSDALGNEILATPNNVLAVEYLKANERLAPIAVKRHGSFHGEAGSASDVREKIYLGKSFEELVPESTCKILNSSPIADSKVFESLVLYKLRTSAKEEIKNVPDVTEGLENRICEAALRCATLDELCANIKTKRYTMARIRRILTNLLLGITKDDLSAYPQYIRILGMNEKGKKILADLKRKTPLPIIIKTADADMCRMLKIDIRASDIYSVITKQHAAADFKNSPIVI